MPGLRHVGAPSTVSVPLDGSRKPAIICRIVDLPAPFGPSSPVTPGPTDIVMSLTATTLPYQRLTPASSIVPPGAAALVTVSTATGLAVLGLPGLVVLGL